MQRKYIWLRHIYCSRLGKTNKRACIAPGFRVYLASPHILSAYICVMKERLIGKNIEDLKAVAAEAGLPRFAASQLAQWLYVKRVESIDGMSNISKAGREALKERYVTGVTRYSMVQTSADGTRKYLFPVGQADNGIDGKGETGLRPEKLSGKAVPDSEMPESGMVEAVMIPDEDRATLCVSSQSGCRMGCRFCMTGRQGFHGNLTANEIINQIFSIPEAERLTNIVYMGMGEPTDNLDEVLKTVRIMTEKWGLAWSPKRITVSTIGAIPGLQRLLRETHVHIAISVHSPFHDERKELMPIEAAFPVSKVMELLRGYDFAHQRRLSVEYIMWRGVNDDDNHADALASLLKGTSARVNLIRFHAIPGVALNTSDEKRMTAFRDYLNSKGVLCTIRRSRGEDIMAACGMLAGKKLK